MRQKVLSPRAVMVRHDPETIISGTSRQPGGFEDALRRGDLGRKPGFALRGDRGGRDPRQGQVLLLGQHEAASLAVADGRLELEYHRSKAVRSTLVLMKSNSGAV